MKMKVVFLSVVLLMNAPMIADAGGCGSTAKIFAKKFASLFASKKFEIEKVKVTATLPATSQPTMEKPMTGKERRALEKKLIKEL